MSSCRQRNSPRAYRLLLLVASFTVALSYSAPAHATPARASAHVRAAQNHYAAKRYSEALAELQQAHKLDPKPAIMFALAQVHYQLGQCKKAKKLYESFLATNPSTGAKKAARQSIASCKQATVTSEPATDPATTPATITATTPTTTTAEPTTGAQPRGASVAALPSRTAERRDAYGHSPWYRDVLGDALVVTGAVALGIGTGYYVRARSTQAGPFSTYDELETARRRAERKRDRAIISASVGGALVTLGVIRYVTRSNKRRRSSRRTSLLVGPGLVGLSHAASF